MDEAIVTEAIQMLREIIGRVEGKVDRLVEDVAELKHRRSNMAAVIKGAVVGAGAIGAAVLHWFGKGQ